MAPQGLGVTTRAPEDIPQVVSRYIAQVMRDRAHMKALELALDEHLATLTPEQKLEQKAEMRKQLTDGRLAMESLFNRLQMTLG